MMVALKNAVEELDATSALAEDSDHIIRCQIEKTERTGIVVLWHENIIRTLAPRVETDLGIGDPQMRRAPRLVAGRGETLSTPLPKRDRGLAQHQGIERASIVMTARRHVPADVSSTPEPEARRCDGSLSGCRLGQPLTVKIIVPKPPSLGQPFSRYPSIPGTRLTRRRLAHLGQDRFAWIDQTQWLSEVFSAATGFASRGQKTSAPPSFASLRAFLPAPPGRKAALQSTLVPCIAIEAAMVAA